MKTYYNIFHYLVGDFMKKDLLIKLLEKIKKENSFVKLKRWFPSFNETIAIENTVKLSGFQASKLLNAKDEKTFLLYLYKCIDGLELDNETYNFLLSLNTKFVYDWIILLRFLGEENKSYVIQIVKRFAKSATFIEAIETLTFDAENFSLQDLALLKECKYNICEVCDLIGYSKLDENLLNYQPSLITLIGSSCNLNALKIYNLIKEGYLFKTDIYPMQLAKLFLELEPEKAVILEEIMNYESCRKNLKEHIDVLITLNLEELYEEEYEFERAVLADRFRLYVKSHKITQLREQKRVLKNAVRDKNVDVLKDYFGTKEEKCVNVESNVIDIRTRRKI